MSGKSKGAWVPHCGEIVWLEFDSQASRGRAGHRPAIVRGPASYKAKAGVMLCYPTTTKIKGYPLEEAIAGKAASVVLSNAVRSLDWRVRNAKLKGKVPPQELEAIRRRVRLLVG